MLEGLLGHKSGTVQGMPRCRDGQELSVLQNCSSMGSNLKDCVGMLGKKEFLQSKGNYQEREQMDCRMGENVCLLYVRLGVPMENTEMAAKKCNNQRAKLLVNNCVN